MTFDKFIFTNTVLVSPYYGLEVDFLDNMPSSGYIALKEIQSELVGTSVDRDRAEANAAWPTYRYFTRLLIHCECEILAQTPDDYAGFLITTMQIMMPDPTGLQSQQLHGQLTCRPAGTTQDHTLPVQVESPLAPAQTATSPSASPASITFKAFRPYWYRAVSNDYIWLPM